MAAMFAKMAMKGAASQAKSMAKGAAAGARGMAKNAASQARGMAKNAAAEARSRANQMAKNAISFGTAKLNQAQSKVANRMGAMAVGTQAGAPVMVGPRGGNFRLNAQGQRMPMLPVA
jgi:hypothetical protein